MDVGERHPYVSTKGGINRGKGEADIPEGADAVSSMTKLSLELHDVKDGAWYAMPRRVCERI